jgi:hypothetical protein
VVLLLAATGSGSALLWRAYGNGAAFPSFTSAADKAVAIADRPVGLNDFQAFQQQIAGSMQSTQQLLTAQQAEIKRLSDQVSALAGKLDYFSVRLRRHKQRFRHLRRNPRAGAAKETS